MAGTTGLAASAATVGNSLVGTHRIRCLHVRTVGLVRDHRLGVVQWLVHWFYLAIDPEGVSKSGSLGALTPRLP